MRINNNIGEGFHAYILMSYPTCVKDVNTISIFFSSPTLQNKVQL